MLRVGRAPFKLSAYTNQDSEDNPMVEEHAYKAQSAGKVAAVVGSFPAQGTVSLYVGLTSDPVSADNRIERASGSEIATYQSVSGLVAKDEYFEVVVSNTNAIIRWKSFGTLKKPIDFN